ncbi:MAG: SLC13 family permease [Acidiferrobacterales bacterium]|nr:SLC13 family permease [Acidiferrobacterales bacterium]
MDLLTLANITALVITLTFVGAFLTKYEPELIFGTAFVCLLLTGALPVERAFVGLSNPGVITLVCLFIVAGAISATGALNSLVNRLLKPDVGYSNLKVRLLPPVAALSAFFNNTPIVAALTPSIVDWCKRYGLSPAKILLPISYAAIIGGTCTVIGTSTNLIVKGLLEEQFPDLTLGFFEIAWIGVPITVLGLIYLTLFAHRLLPERELVDTDFQNAREYTFEFIAEKAVSGLSVERAGLRGLQGAYLIAVVRGQLRIGNIAPDFLLREGDRLIFSGNLTSISDLVTMDGLRHSDDQVYKLDSTIDTSLLEVIVTASNSIVGQTVKQSNFRKRNQAVIIAVIRNGQRIAGKTGSISIKAGDLLLLHAGPGFVQRHRHSREYLILQGGDQRPSKRAHLRPVAWASLLGIVLLAAFNIMHIVVAAVIGALVVIGTQTITLAEVRRSVDFKVLALIVFAFGFAEAIEHSGLGDVLAASLLAFDSSGAFMLLVGVYMLTLILTELVTNNAAAVIVFALIVDVVQKLELSIIPYAIVIMIAASASFITPLGYQTNLIVFSAGNYKFSDYLKLGIPLSIIVMLTTLFLVPRIWSLT